MDRQENLRYSSIRHVGIFGILGNLILLIIKALAGVVFKSQALIADAVNSAGDIFASCMTYIGNKISSKPVDSTHNFGHGKAEYIFSMLISLSMIVVAIKLIYDSIISLTVDDIVFFSWYSVATCLIAIMIKIFLYKYSGFVLKKYNSILVRANQKDHFNDIIITSCTLLATVLNRFSIFWVDKCVAILISIYILYVGIRLFIDSSNVLMDKAVDSAVKENLEKIILEEEWVKKIDEFYSSPVGDKYYLILTVSVDGNLSTFESHNLADSLEKKLEKEENIYKTTVHINPVEIE